MGEQILSADTSFPEFDFETLHVRLKGVPHVPRCLVMPHHGCDADVNAALSALGFAGLSAVGKASENEAGRVIWAAHRQWFVEGITEEQFQTDVASVVDQSDLWVAFDLTGEFSEQVMARLCPLDLSAEAFPSGSCARSEVAHMMCCVIAIEKGYRLMVMRSFSRDFLHHAQNAMQRLEAQNAMQRLEAQFGLAKGR